MRFAWGHPPLRAYWWLLLCASWPVDLCCSTDSCEAATVGAYTPLIGALDPLTQGWLPHNVGFQFPAPHVARIVPGPEPTQNALNLSDTTSTTNNPFYSMNLGCGNPCHLEEAREHGWRFTASARLTDDFNSNSGGMGLQAWLDGTGYIVLFDLANNNLRATVYDGFSNRSMQLTSGGTGTQDYHTFSLTYDPVTEETAFAFDDVVRDTFQGTENPGHPNAFQFGNLGSTALGSMNFHEVRFETLSPISNVDFNSDGVVDVVDYTVWRDAFGTSSSAGDANGNGFTDRVDYELWRTAYSSQSAAGSGTLVPTNVPEASTLALLVAGLATCTLRRRRHLSCAMPLR